MDVVALKYVTLIMPAGNLGDVDRARGAQSFESVGGAKPPVAHRSPEPLLA